VVPKVVFFIGYQEITDYVAYGPSAYTVADIRFDRREQIPQVYRVVGLWLSL
jgi:hypothetical protein